MDVAEEVSVLVHFTSPICWCKLYEKKMIFDICTHFAKPQTFTSTGKGLRDPYIVAFIFIVEHTFNILLDKQKNGMR